MKMDSALAEALKANTDPNRKFTVVISFRESSGQGVNKETVMNGLQIKPKIVYQNIDAVVADITSEQIEALAKAPEVTAIEADKEAAALNR